MTAWADAVEAASGVIEASDGDAGWPGPDECASDIVRAALPHLIKSLRELAKEARVQGERLSSSALTELHLAGRAYTGMSGRIEKLLDRIEAEAKQ